MSNAFAPIVRARPNPIFGRPVHQGSLPFDYSPILLLKPFGFRIAPDTLSSGIRRATGSRSVLAVSGFRLRARLDFSIPSCSPGQRGITPAFGYSAPHPSAEGTSTPMIHALPSAHYVILSLAQLSNHQFIDAAQQMRFILDKRREGSSGKATDGNGPNRVGREVVMCGSCQPQEVTGQSKSNNLPAAIGQQLVEPH